jgi:hypothetical protein
MMQSNTAIGTRADRIRLVTTLGPRTNYYALFVDAELFCFTSNDDDGLNLGIALAILNLKNSATR